MRRGGEGARAELLSRRYYVNKMVIGLTGSELQAELDRRMGDAMTMAGSREFARGLRPRREPARRRALTAVKPPRSRERALDNRRSPWDLARRTWMDLVC